MAVLQLFTKLGSASRWGLFKAEDGRVRRARLVRTLAEERYADLVSQVQLVEPQAWLLLEACLLYTSPSPRDEVLSRMPSSA